MKAVVYKSPNTVAVEDVADPKIQEETDAILRLTTAAICGSDLHMYEGRAPIEAGQVFGHENMGVIEKVGSAVRSVKVGDRVVLPFNIGCGFCFNCTRGFSNACLTTNPQSHGGGYGYSGMGPHPGGQAELVRVPYADYNCLKLPGTPGDQYEDDFIMLADVFPTGYHATEQAHVNPGDTVAIFGAGPVGLMAALSAQIRGASEIYVVDNVPERLELVKKLGATPVDFSKGDAVDQILALRAPHRESVQNLAAGAGDKMPGVMCTIDAIGYEAKQQKSSDTKNDRKQDPNALLADLIRITNPTGHIGLIGVYFPEDPKGSGDEKKGEFTIALGQAWNKGISIEMGQAPVKKYNVYLRDLILAGKAKPSMIVSHRLALAGAPDAYKKFDARSDGYTKVLLKPQQKASLN
ncbi:MAG: glutathione-independent formaldehyde dehydrogenase, partial [Candidatus Eremiobacteraeota bacterium]|nr:glutathione-independent formaldehyde dehydrogenase [Candidatus Eremiobacteraeota bacterium]